MVIIFKTRNLGFQVDFNESPAAQELIRRLPINGKVRRWDNALSFKTHATVSSEPRTADIKIGVVAYWPEENSVCVFFGRSFGAPGKNPLPAESFVVIGSTLAAPEELRTIEEGEQISMFVVSKKETRVSPYQDERKLSQAEIDQLVKRLLAERG
jgi:hypothetical protein